MYVIYKIGMVDLPAKMFWKIDFRQPICNWFWGLEDCLGGDDHRYGLGLQSDLRLLHLHVCHVGHVRVPEIIQIKIISIIVQMKS